MDSFSQEDLQQNKLKAGLGYLVFFLPLILCKESKLGKYCANQGLLLWIVSILAGILFAILGSLPLIGGLLKLIGKLFQFALLLMGVLCLIQLTTNDRVIELPYIGKFRILQ